MITILAILLVILTLAGAPLFIVISAAALLCFHSMGVDLAIVIVEMYRLAANPMLIALLLFALAGYVLAESQASKRLVRLATACLGMLPGGLAIVALLTCAFFTALTGASGVTIVALGGLLFPALLSEHYPESFSLGLLTTCGSLGLLFPPSLPLIIYGVVADVNVTDLFLAGLLPGGVMIALLSIYSVLQGRQIPRRAASPTSGPRRREALEAVRESLWEILLPVVILGGIFSGVLVVSEAATVAVFYVLVVEVLVHREVKVKSLPSIIMKTVIMVGGIIVILGASLAFNSYLIDQQVPNQLFKIIQTHVESKYTFLILLNLFLLIVGCVLDIFSALVIVVPLIVPIAQNYGINLVHLGIIFLTNLQIGYITPPIGMSLFIASLRFERPILTLYRASFPFLLILLVSLALIAFLPALSLVMLG